MVYERWLASRNTADHDPAMNPPERQWLVKGLFLGGGGKVNGLFGAPKQGKSRFLAQVLAAVHGGVDVVPPVLRRGLLPERTLYLVGEEDIADVNGRLVEYAENLDCGLTANWPIRYMESMGLRLDKPANRRFMERYMKDQGFARHGTLVVIDPLVRVHGGVEKLEALGPMLNWIRAMAVNYRQDWLFVHHSRKLTVEDRLALANNMDMWGRGTGDLSGILDSGVFLDRYGKHGNLVRLYRDGRHPHKEQLRLVDTGSHKSHGLFKLAEGNSEST